MVVVGQLVALAALLVVAASAGWLVTCRLRAAGGAEAAGVRLAAGLGVLGTLLYALAAVGWLHRRAVLILAMGLVAAAVGRWWLAGARAVGSAAAGPPRRRGAASPPRWALGLFAAALLPAWIWSLYPPIAFDATMYHLPFARALATAHRLVVVPDLLFPVMPQQLEALFAGMLLTTGSDVATHLVQWLALATVAVLLFAAGSRFYSRRGGVLAAALWLAHPLAHYQAASAYVDLGLTLFCILALHSWERWREGGGDGWLVLAGAAGGWAAATKHLGLLWIGLLVAATLLTTGARRAAAAPPVAGGQRSIITTPLRRRVIAAAALLLVALLIALPWYGRLYRETGNPFFPVLSPLFGGPLDELDRRLGLRHQADAGDLVELLGHRVVALAIQPASLPAFLWQASFARESFDRQAALAPWHLALGPLAACFALRDRRLGRWLLLVLAYAALWTTADPRFQLPGVALLALVGAAALEHLAASWARRSPAAARALGPHVVLALAVALAAPGPLYALHKLWRLGPLPANAAAREAFLLRQQRGLAGLRALERRYGSAYTVYTLFAPELRYHAKGRLVGQWRGPHSFRRIAPLIGDGAALHGALAAAGVDALLVTDPRLRRQLPADGAFRARFDLLSSDQRSDLYLLARDQAPLVATERGGSPAGGGRRTAAPVSPPLWPPPATQRP